MAGNSATFRIGFTADTTQLKKQLEDTLSVLNKLGKKNSLTAELEKSSKAAIELEAHLRKAINPDTGRLDLSKFNNNLAASGRTLSSYANDLVQLGPKGTSAFLQVSKAIISAEDPLKRSSKLLDSLWNNLKRVANYQFSYKALNLFTGSIRTAYQYSQSLNESLNKIQIVTGNSTEEMAKFSQKANEAAKALSTTTTAYLDASYIYALQGLNEDEIAKRTETTVKMSQVTGDSAEQVSSYMTAIWNNFSDGSQSLEYFSDVITKLGANTASTSAEIAAGLERFASIADTVGLSYEYATASLATIVAETRRSADSVGTSLNTIFTRLQGLKLGDTLEDGTDLTKYSKALEVVGISIKDAAGNVKNLDTILNELGSRWQTLAKDEQIALAQTVAGQRQYATLVSLMDNWGKVLNNVTMATGSEGELTRQAEVYANSWKAARDQVRAAAEGIYDSLINDEFYTKMAETLVPFLTTLEKVIDNLGGMSGLLSNSVQILTTVYNQKIADVIRDMVYNTKVLLGLERDRLAVFQQQVVKKIEEVSTLKATSANEDREIMFVRKEVELRQLLQRLVGSMSKQEQELYAVEIEQVDIMKKRVDDVGKKHDKLVKKAAAARKELDQEQKAREKEINNNYQNAMVDNSGVQTSFVNKFSPLNNFREVYFNESYVKKIGNEFGKFFQDELFFGTMLNRGQIGSAIGDESDVELLERMTNSTKALLQYSEQVGAAEKEIHALTGYNFGDKRVSNIKQYTNEIKEILKTYKLVNDEQLDNISSSEDLIRVLKKINEANSQIKTGGVAGKSGGVSQLFESVLRKSSKKGEKEEIDAYTQAVQESVIAEQQRSAEIVRLENEIQEKKAASTQKVKENSDLEAQEYERLKEKVNELIEALQTRKYQTFDFAQTITDTARAMSGAMNVYTTFSNLAKNLASDGTPGDKILAFAQGLTQITFQIGYIGQQASKIGGLAESFKALGRTLMVAKVGTVELGAAFSAALPAIQLIALAISAAVSVYQYFSTKAEEAEKKATELAQKQHEAALQEIESSLELINNYEELYEAYRRTGEGQEELIKLSNELSDKFNIQNAQVLLLTGKYKELSEAIKQAKIQMYQQQLGENLTGGINAADAYNAKIYQINNGNTGNIFEVIGNRLTEEQIRMLQEDERFKEFYDFSQDKNGEWLITFKTVDNDSAVVRLYDLLMEYGGKSEFAHEASQAFLKELTFGFDEIVAGEREELEKNRQIVLNIAKESVDLDNIFDPEQAKEAADTMTSILAQYSEQVGFTEEQIQELVRTIMLGSKAQKQFLEYDTQKRGLDKFSGTDQQYWEQLISGKTQLEIIAVLDAIESSSTLEQFEGLVSNKIGNAIVEGMAQSRIQLDKDMVEINKSQNITDEQYQNFQQNEFLMQQIEAFYGTLDNFRKTDLQDQIEFLNSYYVITTVKSQELLAAETKLLEDEYKLKSEYAIKMNEITEDQLYYDLMAYKKSYQDAMASESDDKKKNQELYLNLYLKTLDELRKKYGLSLEEVSNFEIEFSLQNKNKINTELDELETKLDKLRNTQIELSINWSDMDKIFAQINNLDNMHKNLVEDAKQVGNGYRYTADQVMALAKTYPELFAQAIHVGNGMVEINKEVVDSYISGNQAQVESEIDKNISIFQMDADSAKEKIDQLDSEIQAFTQMKTGEVDISQATTDTIAGIYSALTGALEDEGIDQETAHKLTRAKMATDDVTLSKAVAAAASKNTENIETSTHKSYIAFYNFSKGVSQNTKEMTQGIAELCTSIGDLMTGKTHIVDYSAFTVTDILGGQRGVSGWTAEGLNLDDAGIDFRNNFDDNTELGANSGGGSGKDNYEQRKEELQKKLAAAIDSIIASKTIERYIEQNRYNNDMARIASLEALKNRPLGGYDTGKGGGSSGGKDNSPKEVDPKEYFERYHRITRQLQVQEQLISSIEATMERTYGPGMTDLFNKEIEATNKKLSLQEEMISMINEDLEIDKNLIIDKGLIPEIDPKNNELINYEQLKDQIYKEYNDYIENTWNKYTTEEQQAHEKEKKAQDELFQDRMTAIDRYEDTVDQLNEKEKEHLETMRKKQDIIINKITHPLQWKLDVKGIMDTAQEFSKQINSAVGDALDYGTKNIDIDAQIFRRNKSLYPDIYKTYNDLMYELQTSTDPNDRQKIVDELKSLQSTIESVGGSMLEFVNNLQEAVPNAVEAANNSFSKLINQLSHNMSLATSIGELSKLQGMTYRTAEGYDILRKAQMQNYQANLASAKLQKEKVDELRNSLSKAQELVDAVPEDQRLTAGYDLLVKNRDALLSAYNEAIQAMIESGKSSMEAAREYYTLAVQKIMDNMKNTLTDGLGDLLDMQLDNFIEEQEYYLDAVNTKYEVDKYNNKLQQDIDKATNKRQKEMYEALQDEMVARAANNELSEYDLDIMEAKYKVAQAQAALEDAQNNKTTLRLVRDRQGNWNYQYTSNPDETDKAQQDLADAQNEFYNIAKKRNKELAKESQDLRNQMLADLEAVDNDFDLSLEEKEKRREEIKRHYTEKINMIDRERKIAIDDLKEAGLMALDDYDNAYAESLRKLGTNSGQVAKAIEQYMVDITDATNQYEQMTSEVVETVGTDYQGLNKILGEVAASTNRVKEEGIPLTQALYNQVEQVRNLSSAYKDLADQAYYAARQLEDVNKKIANGVNASTGSFFEPIGTTTNSGNASSNNSYSGDLSRTAAQVFVNSGYKVTSEVEDILNQRANRINSMPPEEAEKYTSSWEILQYLRQAESDEEKKKKLEDIAKGIAYFDTGGYTGTFDNTKLAFLHEKELVLNQEDTENILAAIDMLRNLESQLDRRASLISQMNFSQLKLGSAREIIESFRHDFSGATQNIHINADFPGVSSAAEIEAAFDNLLGRASQYINIKGN